MLARSDRQAKEFFQICLCEKCTCQRYQTFSIGFVLNLVEESKNGRMWTRDGCFEKYKCRPEAASKSRGLCYVKTCPVGTDRSSFVMDL
jgi:hypothetical protein